MASETVVLGSSPSVGQTSSLTPSSEGSLVTTVIVSSRSIVSQAAGLESMWQSYRDKGFSEPSEPFIPINTLRTARNASTREPYDVQWRVFSCWCGEWDFDPFQVPVSTVLEFLQHLFHEGKVAVTWILLSLYSIFSCNVL